MEQTVILIKPDAVGKRFIGQIIDRFERKGFTLKAAKFVALTDEILEKWYSHHKDKPFFGELKSFMQETPVVAMVWEGEQIVAKVRDLCGPTDSRKAAKGTIRGDFGEDIQRNAIHASEDEANARKEINLLFSSSEIYGNPK